MNGKVQQPFNYRKAAVYITACNEQAARDEHFQSLPQMNLRPIVTCLMLTRNRREWLPKAIASYRAQTYTPRELVIVVDGEDVSDLIPNDSDIRVIQSANGARIGQKRNLGCEIARGELIAHFDDDDYSAPERLNEQVSRLLASGKAITGFHSMLFTDGASWWLNRNAPPFVYGASICYRRDWWERHPFPSLQIGEDTAFVFGAAPLKQVDWRAAEELMYATIHPGNTSRRHIGEGWELVAR